MRGLAEAVRVTVEAFRVLLEAMRVIIEAVRKIIEAVRLLVEAVRVIVEGSEGLHSRFDPVKFRAILRFAFISQSFGLA